MTIESFCFYIFAFVCFAPCDPRIMPMQFFKFLQCNRNVSPRVSLSRLHENFKPVVCYRPAFCYFLFISLMKQNCFKTSHSSRFIVCLHFFISDHVRVWCKTIHWILLQCFEVPFTLRITLGGLWTWQSSPLDNIFAAYSSKEKQGKVNTKTLNTVRPYPQCSNSNDWRVSDGTLHQSGRCWLVWAIEMAVVTVCLICTPPHCFLHAWLYVGPLYLQVLVQSASKTRGLYLDGFHCVWGSHAQRTFPGHLRSGLMWNFTLLHQIK